MSSNTLSQRLLGLLQQHRWGALATTDSSSTPLASMVGYVMGDEPGVIYLHLSRLAAHTANLLVNWRAALVVSEYDMGRDDPQALERVTLQGTCQVVERDSEEYSAARLRYLQRLPASERLFGFSDFILFRLNVENARFVGGFAQARSFTREELRSLA